jgi:predicted ArsR family transcriptional regulator
LGQTSERVWLDLVNHPGSTAGEVADRLGVSVDTVRRTVKKLVQHRLVRETGARSTGIGRPSTSYEIEPDTRLDDVAEELGVMDWHEKTADRYERERAGHAEVLRQRTEATEAKAAADPFTVYVDEETGESLVPS